MFDRLKSLLRAPELAPRALEVSHGGPHQRQIAPYRDRFGRGLPLFTALRCRPNELAEIPFANRHTRGIQMLHQGQREFA